MVLTRLRARFLHLHPYLMLEPHLIKQIPEVSVRMFLRPCSAGAPPPDERRKPGRLASARPFGWIEHTQLTRRCRNWRLQVGRHLVLSPFPACCDRAASVSGSGPGPDRFVTSAARWASFDYVDSLARAGQLEKARNTFEKMLTYANHLGLQDIATDPGQSMTILTVEAGSPSEEALNLLAGWTAAQLSIQTA